VLLGTPPRERTFELFRSRLIGFIRKIWKLYFILKTDQFSNFFKPVTTGFLWQNSFWILGCITISHYYKIYNVTFVSLGRYISMYDYRNTLEILHCYSCVSIGYISMSILWKVAVTLSAAPRHTRNVRIAATTLGIHASGDGVSIGSTDEFHISSRPRMDHATMKRKKSPS
jgi:hypothetical protein